MEIFKNLNTPASKEFEQLLNTQLSKTKNLVEGKIMRAKSLRLLINLFFWTAD